MGMRLRRICRGSGKIYALVKVPRGFGVVALMAHAWIEDGHAVPAKVLPYRETGDYVLVLAVLDVEQTVRIRATDAQGQIIMELRHRIHPRRAKLSSQAHTFLKDRTLPMVRNFDARPGFGDFGIGLMRVVRTYGPQGLEDVLQAETRCTSDDYELLSQNMEITLLDRTGNVASLTPCVLLRDAMEPVPHAPSCFERGMQFSFRIPCELDACVLWVRPVGGKPGPCGFLAIEPHVFAWWRNDWAGLTLPAFDDGRYEATYHMDWETSPIALAVQRRTELHERPTFSVVVPLYHTPVAFLDDMIASVLAQTYGAFELVLVNASVADEELAQAVDRWRALDERIVVIPLEENLGIAENTNAGIRAATGDIVCFLDHDDTLVPDALFCYAQACDEYPDTDLFYSDEDHLEDGAYKNPYFKPDWNPDLLLGMNYVCHFLGIRRSVLERMTLPTRAYDGSQDHYLALYASELARNIYHCRRVLYHWRIHPASTANNTGEKPYAIEAGVRAIQAHLDRCGILAAAMQSPRVAPAEARFEVSYELPDQPLVSILIPNKDAVPILDRCLRSIREKTIYDAFEVVIIENNSEDPQTFAYYERAMADDKRVRVVHYEGSFNYAKINNFGASQARGAYYLLLNNDTEVISPHWIARMVSLCAREETGVVGAKLLYPDGTIQHAGVLSIQTEGPGHMNMFRGGNEVGTCESIRMMQDVSAVTGACLMTRASVFDEVGGMDTDFPVDYNDIDYCWAVQAAGYRVVYDPSVELYHFESMSRGFHPTPESALRFERAKGRMRVKWPERYAFADPMGNPNFNQASRYFGLR